MEFIKELLIGYGMGEKGSNYLSAIILVILIILLCVVANYVTKKNCSSLNYKHSQKNKGQMGQYSFRTQGV